MFGLPYQGVATFLKSPLDAHRPFGFVGIPYDGSVTFRPGARLAPNAIRRASMMLTDGHHPEFATDPCERVTDLGDIDITQVAQHAALARIEEAVTALGQARPSCRLMMAGGDHLTMGVLRALRRRFDQPLALIHFDAHCDTWARHFGDDIGHGTFLRNAIEEGVVDPTRTMSLGLRSPVDPVTREWLIGQGGLQMSSRQLMRTEGEALARHVRERIGDAPVYVTFDIDVLDPAHAPGTGTPEIGGITTMKALELLESLRHCNMVGMDVVEVSPPFDNHDVTALAAATLLWTWAAMLPL
ncbi:agmatinase [Kushneria phosphatilytica]|uniref:agmatinase n=1 Tax=Kushneria phosphatilytica TaxID=657387 RepID=UPI0008DA3144|nr:agmatinase [Kushneria phosphatilytica]OHV13810.1 agmatinase [Kushneria phosphatilytica]